jgi:NAD(P)H-flavin reductase
LLAHAQGASENLLAVSLVTVPLVDVAVATPRTRLLTVALGPKPYHFVAGQAVMVGMHGQAERRPYSLACSPERAAEQRRLELLIGLESDGTLGPHLPTMATGTLLDLEGPLGTFIFPEPPTEERMLFVAGGTGIAPLRGMLDHALRRHPSMALSVLYSARRADEFAFIDELRKHARAGRITLHQTVTRDDSTTWSGGRGRIGRSHFENVLREPARTLCFVCGPATFVSESATTLEALGVPGELIRTEGWGR